MGLELSQRPVLKQALEQRQELKLVLKIAPPDGWSFREPPPTKEIETYKGKPAIRIQRSELESFADAVKNILQLLGQVDPRVVLVSMRGAIPLFRCLVKAVDQKKRVDGDWTTRAFELRRTNFTAAKLYTSYFIDGLSEVVGEGLKNAFETAAGGDARRVVFLDTSVTGTKLGWFMPQFIEGMGQVAEQLGRIELVNIILHHAKPGMRATEQLAGNVSVTTHNFGVESLITEDNPTLLGVDLRKIEQVTCAEGAIGEIHAYEDEVPAGILIEDGSNVSLVRPRHDEKTAALFARLIGDVARST
ncbi:hypothetical protein J4450_02190 [Candidatus Micrarchaeota archaeon]|nr:hypothetical protein [Candidatus Micrarchaeota archaeon]